MIVCFDASYMGAKKVSNKARCSMAPRNCEWEVSQIITLKNGMKKTIYYCLFDPATLVAEPVKPLKEQNNKTSCRLDGG